MALAATAAAKLVTLTPPSTSGTPIAVVWIQGALCNNEAYQEIAQAVQMEGAKNNQAIWVGIPSFISGSPDPVTISGKVDSTIKELEKLGFTGDNIVMAGHSLGGVMAQGYTADNADKIKAQVLMGSVLTRDKRSIDTDGTTVFDYGVPTMAIGGSKDGLMRMSRVAESFWHTNMNVNEHQANLFPTVAFEGVSHAQFMSGKPPINVSNKDLVPDVTYDVAHGLVAESFVQFMDQIIKNNRPSLDTAATKEVLQGMIDAMELEGYYGTKPACEQPAVLVNAEDPTCLHGSPWNMQYSQIIMGGELPGTNMSIDSNDNFHPVQEVNPVHLAEIDSDCTADSVDCVMKMITVTENHYEDYDKMDTGYHPQAASEMKSKQSSRQKIQQHAGNSDAKFHESDEVGNRCADINNASIQWAYEHLSENAKANYDKYGVQLVTGDDMGPYNEGPLWIWTLMNYTKSEDGTQMVVKSPMMRTPTNYLVKSAAGFHYCKVLSPFKAIEWMYLDGLYDNNGIKNQVNYDELFLQ